MVTEVGTEVTKYAVGDRVGVGCMVDSCRECVNCLAGEEQYCLRATSARTRPSTATARSPTAATPPTSWSTRTTSSGSRRPPDEAAAPLLCAGITTYSPLAHWKVGPGTRVAVVGLGGLGHMAVKIAHAHGGGGDRAHAVAAQEGGRPAARCRSTTTRPATRRPSRSCGSFDLIVNTVSAAIDVDAYLGLLALDGTMVNVGAPPEPLPIQVFSLFGNRRSFAGSSIGGIRETQEMLDFCAEHGIAADDRDDRRRPDQRGVRAGAGQRRALPVRDRHRDPGLTPVRRSPPELNSSGPAPRGGRGRSVRSR